MSIDLNAVYPIIDIEDAEYILGVQNGLGIRVNKPEPPEPPAVTGSRFILNDAGTAITKAVLEISPDSDYMFSSAIFRLAMTDINPTKMPMSCQIPEIEMIAADPADGYTITFGGCGSFSNIYATGTKLVFGEGILEINDGSVSSGHAPLLLYTGVDESNNREICIPDSVVGITGAAFSIGSAPEGMEEALAMYIPRSVKFLGIPDSVSSSALDFSYFTDDTEGDPLVESIELFVPWSESGDDRPDYADALEAHFTDVTYEWTPES